MTKLWKPILNNHDCIAPVAAAVKMKTENAVIIDLKKENWRRKFVRAFCSIDARYASSWNRH